MEVDPNTLLMNAEWLAHRHVEDTDRFRFVRVLRAEHATIPFLTDDCLGPRQIGGDLPAVTALNLPENPPLGFIFHSAFCGSTLLTRALSRGGTAMGLSEPVLLNDLVGLRRRGAQPSAVARMADLATRLLGRPFAPGESIVVKPSNVVNPLAELLLALRPQSNALFLYAPLETFLISVVRKGLPCRLWVRELLAGYLHEGFVALGFEPEDYFRQTDLQVAAVGWLAQHAYFHRLAAKIGPGRIRSLDADQMTAQPFEAIQATAAHLGLHLDEAAVAEIISGPSFTRHSKSGQSFSAGDRTAEYAAAREAHGAEIDLVLEWAGQVAANAGIPLEGPLPLLDQA